MHFSIEQVRKAKIAKVPAPTKFGLCIQYICHLQRSHSCPLRVQMVTPQIFEYFMIMALDSSSASLIIPTVLSVGLIMDKDTRL